MYKKQCQETQGTKLKVSWIKKMIQKLQISPTQIEMGNETKHY